MHSTICSSRGSCEEMNDMKSFINDWIWFPIMNDRRRSGAGDTITGQLNFRLHVTAFV